MHWSVTALLFSLLVLISTIKTAHFFIVLKGKQNQLLNIKETTFSEQGSFIRFKIQGKKWWQFIRTPGEGTLFLGPIHQSPDLSQINVHVGAGAWIFNIPGGAIEAPGNNDLPMWRYKIVQFKERHRVVIGQNFAQSLRSSWRSNLSFMKCGDMQHFLFGTTSARSSYLIPCVLFEISKLF